MKIHGGLPIGIFDSGLGGLTVVKEISKRLPHENLIYVGDTARVPYGTKSPLTIKRYAMQIAFFLMQKKVKAVVVACNSASAVALGALKNFPVPVIGVIHPGAKAAVQKTQNKKVGVIGTPATIASHAYKKAIHRNSRSVRVYEQPCPLFVPLVEEGRVNDSITRQVAQEYLRPLKKKKIDSVVLGCTHYPLLKKCLKGYLGSRVPLVDSAEETAKEVAVVLSKHKWLNPSLRKGKSLFYTTDDPILFKKLGFRFMGSSIRPVQHLPLESL